MFALAAMYSARYSRRYGCVAQDILADMFYNAMTLEEIFRASDFSFGSSPRGRGWAPPSRGAANRVLSRCRHGGSCRGGASAAPWRSGGGARRASGGANLQNQDEIFLVATVRYFSPLKQGFRAFLKPIDLTYIGEAKAGAATAKLGGARSRPWRLVRRCGAHPSHGGPGKRGKG